MPQRIVRIVTFTTDVISKPSHKSWQIHNHSVGLEVNHTLLGLVFTFFGIKWKLNFEPTTVPRVPKRPQANPGAGATDVRCYNFSKMLNAQMEPDVITSPLPAIAWRPVF